MVSGQLALRGGEPLALEAPTTLTGTNTDGQLTNVMLATPAVRSTRAVEDYNTTVDITARFSMVEPGVGTINEDGSMTVQVRLAVDLHLVVALLPDNPSDCRSAPINLTLTSTASYDGEQVSLRAPNFTVPAVTSSAVCSSLFVPAVNDALAGSGHALSLTMAGAITPPAAGEPTSTTLSVTPIDQARVGTEVTLAAAVVPDPAVVDAPAVSGVVAFFDGATSLGTADVDPATGVAAFTTTALLAGPRQLRAAYAGAPPDWQPSQSGVVAYTVIADPAVVTTATGEVVTGGPGKDFDLTVINTGFGAPLADARVEVQISRQVGTGAIGPAGGVPHIVLSRVVAGTATPIPLTFSGTGARQLLAGTIADTDTWAVAPGAEHTENLRLEAAAGTPIGPLDVVFTLVTGEGATRTILGATTGVVTIVNETRVATTIGAGVAARPPIILSRPPITPVVRQGNVAEFAALTVTPGFNNVYATGTYTFAIDGVPTLGQHANQSAPAPFTWSEVVPKRPIASETILVKVPATTPTGVRQVTVRYLGDAIFAPSQATFPITVEPSVGTIYACQDSTGVGSSQYRFTANVEVQATLPTSWPAGQDLPVDRVQVRMVLSRTVAQEQILNSVTTAPEEARAWRLGLDPDGAITPTAVTSTNAAAWQAVDTLPPDRLIDLTGGAGTLSMSPIPGAVSAYALDRIVVTAQAALGLTAGFTCTPDGEPYTVGMVVSAGTTLAVDRQGPVGVGQAVALTATALPVSSGVVEFRDGSTTIGVVPVDGAGVASMSTTALPAGIRSLSARFFGGVGVNTPSPVVELRVIGECPGFLDVGNGAVVRLVYLELLGRCPDAAGYAFWVERLDGGTTPEAFARSIARTPEAVGRVVDDAYRTMLGRPADAAGRAFWTGRLLGHGRYDQLLADLGASPEFWSLAGSTDAGFVTRVYDRLLHRVPEQVGLDYWTGRLAAGASPRALVLSLANLDEPLGVLVADSYVEILDRAPDAGERASGIAHLRSTGDRSGLYAQLIGQPEFGDRAQAFPG